MPSAGASAIGDPRSARRPASPVGESPIPPWSHAAHTAPPADAEKATIPCSAPHSTQLSRCGRKPASQSSLSWNERTSGSRAGRPARLRRPRVQRIEESRQGEERAVVPLLLGVQPEHRLEADQPDLEAVRVDADRVVRADE